MLIRSLQMTGSVSSMSLRQLEIVLDGNRPRAKPRVSPRTAVHERGVNASTRCGKQSLERGIASAIRHPVLNRCFDYGCRWDNVSAALSPARRGEVIKELFWNRATAMSHVGDPDLLITTGNDYRFSNFLISYAAYTQLHFSLLLWPEFDQAALDKAIAALKKRERRFRQKSSSITNFTKAD